MSEGIRDESGGDVFVPDGCIERDGGGKNREDGEKIKKCEKGLDKDEGMWYNNECEPKR